MKNLISLWERRASKYKSLADKSFNELVVQGLLAQSEAYQICADELKQEMEVKP